MRTAVATAFALALGGCAGFEEMLPPPAAPVAPPPSVHREAPADAPGELDEATGHPWAPAEPPLAPAAETKGNAVAPAEKLVLPWWMQPSVPYTPGPGQSRHYGAVPVPLTPEHRRAVGDDGHSENTYEWHPSGGVTIHPPPITCDETTRARLAHGANIELDNDRWRERQLADQMKGYEHYRTRWGSYVRALDKVCNQRMTRRFIR